MIPPRCPVESKAEAAGKPKLELMCKPRSSGPHAPEPFYENVGFKRNNAQDRGLVEHPDVHKRRCKMTKVLDLNEAGS